MKKSVFAVVISCFFAAHYSASAEQTALIGDDGRIKTVEKPETWRPLSAQE